MSSPSFKELQSVRRARQVCDSPCLDTPEFCTRRQMLYVDVLLFVCADEAQGRVPRVEAVLPRPRSRDGAGESVSAVVHVMCVAWGWWLV